ncbi:hypothetical protein EDI_173100 [Entamoeba dispar SAW760]|uniref:Uncharacterized protein n=1 Tax=Entamoeba dispar (strain ATCC PRA-260 / SAW760) TaxID=370354 RepID=B0ELH5_ENTDS|nr:uncharacterized protein EDI_173100 [Entamoeba dispar SAW760]EDR24621.1 hypothetical protein EDI_173100 [Entamoeba dispar SAW760]|eukprot:EDR24621.1 hypothetical protein EDI_173100 [Entamoeba dispar SAW760]
MGIQTMINTLRDLVNKIPVIRTILNGSFLVILLLPFVFIPGAISAFYLVVFLLVSLGFYITKMSVLRVLSYLVACYSIFHFTANIIFVFSDSDNSFVLFLCGLNFKYYGLVRSCLHFGTVLVLFFFSFLYCLTKKVSWQPIPSKFAPALTSLILFCCSLVLNTSQGGILPLVIMVISTVSFFVPKRIQTWIFIPTSILLSIYLLCWTLFTVYSWTAHEYGLINDLTLKNKMKDIFETIGFTTTTLNSWVFSWLMFISYIFVCLNCGGIYLLLISNKTKEKYNGYERFQSDEGEKEENEETTMIEKSEDIKEENKSIWNKMADHMKVIMKQIVLITKLLIQITIDCGLYVSLGIMFCVGLVDISFLGFCFMIISICFVFIPPYYSKKMWPLVIVFIILQIITEIIVQLPIIDISTIPSYIGLKKFNDQPTETSNFDLKNTILSGTLSRIILLVIAILQHVANKIGYKITTNADNVEIIKYCFSKIVDFWGIFICCFVIAFAAFFESINIELMMYIIALGVLVLIQIHFSNYKKIIRVILPIYAIIFLCVLIVRYVIQMDVIISDDSQSESPLINSFWDIFTKMNQSELGLVKYNSLWERLLGFSPNIIVIVICFVESRLLITLPKYLKNVRQTRREIRKRKQDCNKNHEKEIEEEIKVPKKIKEISDLFMRFLSIYLPHISIICAIIFAAYPTIYTTPEIETWDLLHFLLFASILIALLMKKGFNAACIPLLWVCTLSSLILIIPNFHTINDFINQSGIFKTEETKEWFYKLIGLKTCYENNERTELCETFEGIYYPKSWELLKEFIIILFIIILSRTSYFWGEKYKKRNTLVLFHYTDISKEKEGYSINKIKYYMSNFFSVFGSLIVLIVILLCCAFHSNDIICIFYISLAIGGIRLPYSVITKIIPIIKLILVILLTINSIWTIPLTGGPIGNWQRWSNWDWDIDQTLRRYILLVPTNSGIKLLLSRIFDALCIFLINRLIYNYHEGHSHDIYKFISPYYFPKEIKTLFDSFIKLILKNINLICSIIIILLAITRKDMISYIYIGMMFYVVFKGNFLKQRKIWIIIQGINAIILVLQNVIVLSNMLNYFILNQSNKTITNFITVLFQLLRAFGLNTIAGKEFYINLIIFFVLLIRIALFKQLPEVFKQIKEIEEEQKEIIFSRTRELIDLDRDKILIELDKEYNDKIMRMVRLEELRKLRKKEGLNDLIEQPKIIEPAQFLSTVPDSSSFIEKIIKWTKNYLLKGIDIFIHFLHNRNLVVRLNIPKDANEEEIKKELKDTIRPIIQAVLINLESTEEEQEQINDTEILLTKNETSETISKKEKRYELLPIKKHSIEPYKYKSRLYMIFWGIWFYCSEQTEVFIQILFILNHLFNQNILSSVYPILGFSIIMMCKRPNPSKIIWNIISCYCFLLVFIRMLVELPGFCLTSTRYEKYDALSYTTDVIQSKTLQCDSKPLTYNHMSPVYLIGIYPVENYITSSFIWDIICLFSVIIHISSMRSRGYWKQQYLLRRQWSNIIIENYRRQLVNKIYPGTYGELLFIIETITNFTSDNSDYLSYKRHDLFVVDKIQDNGMLFVKKGNKQGLIHFENVRLFEQQNDKIKKQKICTIKPQHKETFDNSYSIISDDADSLNDEFDLLKQHEVELMNQNELEVTDVINFDKLESYLHKREIYLKEQDEIYSHTNKYISFIKSIYLSIKKFFTSITNDQFKRGRDLYIPMFICELLCFLFLVIFQGAFTNSEGSFIEFFTSDYLPIFYVLGLLLQFVMILIDRIIYLCKSIKAKLIMQYFSLILYHGLIFIIYPSILKTKTHLSSICLTIFYLFKVVYWTISGLQIKSGYLILSSKRILMANYSYISSLIFSTYYTLPFVYEIRTILDWTFAKTSMFYKLWLKVEDIHAELYMNQCDREIEKSRNHVYGESRGIMEKLTGGCIMIVIMLSILWFPLLLMSSAAPNFIQPKPTNVEITFSLAGNGKFFDQEDSSFTELTGAEWKVLGQTHDLKKDASLWVFGCSLSLKSMSYWSLTPDKKEDLNTTLCNGKQVMLKTKILMSREDSAAVNTFELNEKIILGKKELQGFCDLLNDKENNFTLSFFPEIVSMPTLSQTELLRYDSTNISLIPKKGIDNKTQLSYWWFETTNGSTVVDWYVSSPNVPDTGVISSLSSKGIIGLYTVVVLTLYSLIKSDYSGLSHTVMFKNLPNCHGLLQLCDDIIMARQDGDLKLEEDLVDELIMIYRTPSLLVEKTKID